MKNISGLQITPGKSHAHVLMEVLLRLSSTIYTSTVRIQALEGPQYSTDLSNYKVAVAELEDQVARLPAIKAGSE